MSVRRSGTVTSVATANGQCSFTAKVTGANGANSTRTVTVRADPGGNLLANSSWGTGQWVPWQTIPVNGGRMNWTVYKNPAVAEQEEWSKGWPRPLGREGIEALFRTVGDQVSMCESLLPEELARVDTLLDDPAFFVPFAPHFDPLTGRPSTPVECCPGGHEKLPEIITMITEYDHLQNYGSP